jgi:hypothetical protein
MISDSYQLYLVLTFKFYPKNIYNFNHQSNGQSLTKERQLERNFEELKPASHVPILGTILNIFDVFVAVFFSPLNSLNLITNHTSGIFVAPLESNYG